MAKLTYNLAQYLAYTQRSKSNMWEWGRGTGKSTAIGGVLKDLVYAMPRSCGVIVGKTYQQILTRTLPSTINGLRMHGLHKDVHYYVGRRPPKSWGWPEPYMPPLDYKNCIIFWNGAVAMLVSQDRPGTGRGMNTDWIIGDEAALLNKVDLDNDVRLTCRGSVRKIFKGNPLFTSEYYATSTPVTSEGNWIYDFESEQNAGNNEFYFLRAPSHVNIANLGEAYFRRLKATLYPHVYDAEVLCKKPSNIENGFYPLLDMEQHTYEAFEYSYYDSLFDYSSSAVYSGKTDCRGDNDLNKSLPLLAGVDWGAAINCMVVAQNDKKRNTLFFLKSLYVLGREKKMLDDLANDFVEYYKHHPSKLIYLFYDSTGNNSQANTHMTYIAQFSAILIKAGWRVIKKTKGGTNPRHHKKFLIWSNLLREEQGEYRELPVCRFNKSNTKELLVSMRNAGAKMSSKDNEIQKDKSSERSKKIKREHATDLSDAADTIVHGIGEGWVPDGMEIDMAPLL